jgi:agmatine/peptidylarginine deiminase
MTRWRLPAEWEAQDGVIVAWPHAGTDWADNLADVEHTYEALVAAIARFERVVVIVADEAIERHARARVRRAGVPDDRVQFVRVPYDDTWLRDSGPITLVDADDARKQFRLLDFRFTGWGGKFEASRDDALIGQLHAHGVFANAAPRRIDWALEGGAIESDGQGTVMSTLACLRQRHPKLSRGELADALATHLCAKHVLILEHGSLEGDDTDAHIDTLARFAAPDHIVYQACDNPSDSHHAVLAAMATELRALRDAEGKPYRLTPLPWAREIRDAGGRRLAASYANFLIVDGGVLMPAYGDTADAHAQNVLRRAFPGREVVAVPCRPLIEQNGSLHCVTMQMPRGLLAQG